MNLEAAIPIAVFVSVALGAGSIASLVLAQTAPGRRRLHASADSPDAAGTMSRLQDLLRTRKTSQLSKVARNATSGPTRLQRRMEMAGWTDVDAASYYSLAEVAVPVIFALVPLAFFGRTAWLGALVAAGIGYIVPDLVLTRAIQRRQKGIQNGLPDAIDLIVVCVEAGSSLDQAIVRASEELDLAVPALATELRTVTNEIRAGKPRLEAFQGLAKRTQVDDVRALVAMLTQTDRFGTSIAQALRTHASTSRTKRRQRAEERAAKVGVKMVFPLALCLIPALYVVCLGPVVVKIMRSIP
jgi:tight adherence protein C